MDGRWKGGRQYERSEFMASVENLWWHFIKTITMVCTEQAGPSKAEDSVKFILNIKSAFSQEVAKVARFAICWDNASIDKGDWVKQYCEEGSISILFITPTRPSWIQLKDL